MAAFFTVFYSMKIVFFTFYLFPNAAKVDYMRVQESGGYIMVVLSFLSFQRVLWVILLVSFLWDEVRRFDLIRFYCLLKLLLL